MYPDVFRSPDYGLYAESTLKRDPYAALSGNRQQKSEPRIVNPKSTEQLRSFVDAWMSQR